MGKESGSIYRKILFKEMIPALGCTEPIAVALTAARARKELGKEPEQIDRIDVYCSGNIVKNVKGVTVPNSGGLKGIAIAAAMGITGGDPESGLEVIQNITKEELEEASVLSKSGKIRLYVVGGEANLYIRIELFSGDEYVSVETRNEHTNISRIVKNGTVLLDNDVKDQEDTCDPSVRMSLRGILDYADSVDFEKDPGLRELLKIEEKYNMAVAEEGLRDDYGARVGKTILEMGSDHDLATAARAYASAGSDARMGGCSYPVVINSGSGNQGITVSVPVIIAARELKVSEDKLLRALIISNLTAIHQKSYIGKLSAFCGVVSAAAGAGAGIGYLKGFGYEKISMVVTNTIATIGGMVCDGAKSSCASKIAQALGNVFTAIGMSEHERTFMSGEGLVGDDVEKTIENVGRMARVGMKSTDEEILRIMTEG